MRIGFFIFTICAAGCSFTFDSQAPDITLVGNPPATDSLPKLNHGPAGSDYIVSGYDDNGNENAYWVAFNEAVQVDGGGTQQGLRAVRLTPPEKEEVILADEVNITWTAFYLLQKPAKVSDPITLTIRAAGQTTPPDVFMLPGGGPGFLWVGNTDDVFLYWVLDPATKTFTIYHRDHSPGRDVPVPGGIDPTDPFGKGQYMWSYFDEWLATRDADGNVTAYSTTSDLAVPLGMRPTLLATTGRASIVSCGDDGLHIFSMDGKHEKVLDPTPCDSHGSIIETDNQFFYSDGQDLREVPVDGSAPPKVALPNGLRVLSIWDKNTILYSKTPADQYVLGAGDGWLGSWRFMNRGIDAGFSNDRRRIRWLENAAKANGAGDLDSAVIGQPPLHLTLNTRQYEELPDGRVLADADHAFRGTQNRVVVIDEKTRIAKWVASGAAQYDHIPGSSDLLVDVVSGPSGFDIVRVPVPPPDPVQGPAPPAPDGGAN